MLARMEDADTDEGLAAARRAPQRTCLATRENVPVERMLRFVAAPDGAVVPDLARNLPGRGAWVSASREALEKAIKQKAFSRAFRGKAQADARLLELVDHLIERSALEALSLANKAGRIVTGNAKVESAIVAGKAIAIYHSADGSADGKRKLDGLSRRIEAEGGAKIPSLTLFTGSQLDLALGRPNVVHAALLASPASGGFLERSLRLKRWRDGDIALGDVPGKSNQELEDE
ncbi:MAG: RNA-binding protein [Xanthobacteraceae bacterium]|nr:RNA-binding protein [Xanthobacteraceae bacterium]